MANFEDTCPECESTLIPQEGCLECRNCGWARCEL